MVNAKLRYFFMSVWTGPYERTCNLWWTSIICAHCWLRFVSNGLKPNVQAAPGVGHEEQNNTPPNRAAGAAVHVGRNHGEAGVVLRHSGHPDGLCHYELSVSYHVMVAVLMR